MELTLREEAKRLILKALDLPDAMAPLDDWGLDDVLDALSPILDAPVGSFDSGMNCEDDFILELADGIELHLFDGDWLVLYEMPLEKAMAPVDYMGGSGGRRLAEKAGMADLDRERRRVGSLLGEAVRKMVWPNSYSDNSPEQLCAIGDMIDAGRLTWELLEDQGYRREWVERARRELGQGDIREAA